MLISDASADELLAFRATLDSMRFVRDDGVLSSDVILQPIDVELVGPATSHQWLTSLKVAPGTYTGAALGFVPGSYVAIAQNGASVAVDAAADTATLDFGTPLVVTGNSYDRVAIDVDLGMSLSGSVLAPPVAFDPQGTLGNDSLGDEYLLDEFVGLTKGSSKQNKSINVQAYADEAQQVWLGLVHVQIAPTTLLVATDGTSFTTQDAFFDELIHNKTVLGIRGMLDAKAHVVATRVDVENHTGGPGQSNVVEIEGLVLALDSDSFQLAIGEIEKGEAFAAPVLASYGNPGSIEVGYDVTTKFYLSSNVATNSGSLAVGQHVDVRFSTFVGQPFPAAKVELHTEFPAFAGSTSDLSGLPASFAMNVFAGSHWIPGIVGSSSTDVKVNVIGAPIVLKTKLDPALTGTDLVLGLGVEVEGSLGAASTPAVPIVDASKVKLKAGRLDGTATDVVSASGTLVANGILVQPFGDGVSSGTVTFELEPGCVYEGDADSAVSLQALFDALQVGEVLEVRVEGIGTGVSGQARAFYVRADLVGD